MNGSSSRGQCSLQCVPIIRRSPTPRGSQSFHRPPVGPSEEPLCRLETPCFCALISEKENNRQTGSSAVRPTAAALLGFALLYFPVVWRSGGGGGGRFKCKCNHPIATLWVTICTPLQTDRQTDTTRQATPEWSYNNVTHHQYHHHHHHHRRQQHPQQL